MTKAMILLSLSMVASAADITGEWNLHLVRFGEQFATARVVLKAEGNKLTGTLNELKLNGTVEGDYVRLTGIRPNGKEWGKLEGRVQGDDIAGTVKQGEDEFAWNAHRAKVIQGAPKSYTFDAPTFQRVFSGAIPPVLHIM